MKFNCFLTVKKQGYKKCIPRREGQGMHLFVAWRCNQRDSQRPALSEREQFLDFVGIVASEAARHNFASAACFDDDVGKEEVLVHLDAGYGAETYLGLLAPDDFRFAVDEHLFFVVDDDFVGKNSIAVTRHPAGCVFMLCHNVFMN